MATGDTVGPDEALQAAVDATIALHGQTLIRRQNIWGLIHVHGWSRPSITRAILAALLDRGLTLEQINGLGVSHDSIERVAKGPRPE